MKNLVNIHNQAVVEIRRHEIDPQDAINKAFMLYKTNDDNFG